MGIHVSVAETFLPTFSSPSLKHDEDVAQQDYQ